MGSRNDNTYRTCRRSSSSCKALALSTAPRSSSWTRLSSALVLACADCSFSSASRALDSSSLAPCCFASAEDSNTVVSGQWSSDRHVAPHTQVLQLFDGGRMALREQRVQLLQPNELALQIVEQLLCEKHGRTV